MELPDTTWYSHVFTNHIEVSKVSCLQWHVSSIELNMQLRDILNHLKPTAEAAASTSVFVHLILGQNTYMCFTTLGALPKNFFGFDIPSRSGQPQLSNLTDIAHDLLHRSSPRKLAESNRVSLLHVGSLARIIKKHVLRESMQYIKQLCNFRAASSSYVCLPNSVQVVLTKTK